MWMRSGLCYDVTFFFYQTTRLRIEQNSAECARVHAGVRGVHATSLTLEMCAVRGTVSLLSAQNYGHTEKVAMGLLHAS